jgi:hypothetical protein
MKIYTENELRQRTTCVVCGKPNGGVVCWHCFKYETRFTPLKYWDGSTEDWQKYLIGLGVITENGKVME